MSRPKIAWLVVALMAALAALTGCSTGSTTETSQSSQTDTNVDENAFPVTIEHAFGKTEITEEPKRVVTVGWSDQDMVASLGVAPIGATKITWGGNAQGSTPWFDQAMKEIGAEAPTRYDDRSGIPVDEIAKLDPDLILGTNSGMTQEEYDKLSKIADVVAYPKDPWVTPWDKSLSMVGDALGRSDLAEQKLEETNDALAQAKKDNPSIVGKSFIFASILPNDMSKLDYYSVEDARPLMLTQLGMKNAPVVEKLSKPGVFYATISAERAPELKSDVLLTYAEKPGDAQTFRDDPLIGQVPAIENGHMYAVTDKTASMPLSSPSPIGIPYMIEHFIPGLVKAVG